MTRTVKSYSRFDDLTEKYKWVVYVDGEIHGFGYETQRQSWRQMDKDRDRCIEKALSGNTEPRRCTNARIPNDPPSSAVTHT